MSRTYKVQPPDLKEAKSYAIYKKELEVWELITPVPADKRGTEKNLLLRGNNHRVNKYRLS